MKIFDGVTATRHPRELWSDPQQLKCTPEQFLQRDAGLARDRGQSAKIAEKYHSCTLWSVCCDSMMGYFGRTSRKFISSHPSVLILSVCSINYLFAKVNYGIKYYIILSLVILQNQYSNWIWDVGKYTKSKVTYHRLSMPAHITDNGFSHAKFQVTLNF